MLSNKGAQYINLNCKWIVCLRYRCFIENHQFFRHKWSNQWIPWLTVLRRRLPRKNSELEPTDFSYDHQHILRNFHHRCMASTLLRNFVRRFKQGMMRISRLSTNHRHRFCRILWAHRVVNYIWSTTTQEAFTVDCEVTSPNIWRQW